jgi:hypothetical protein
VKTNDDDGARIIECMAAVRGVECVVRELGKRQSEAFLWHGHDLTYLVAVTTDFRDSLEGYRRDLSGIGVPCSLKSSLNAFVRALDTTVRALEEQERGIRTLNHDRLNEGAKLLAEATEGMRQYATLLIALNDQHGLQRADDKQA